MMRARDQGTQSASRPRQRTSMKLEGARLRRKTRPHHRCAPNEHLPPSRASRHVGARWLTSRCTSQPIRRSRRIRSRESCLVRWSDSDARAVMRTCRPSAHRARSPKKCQNRRGARAASTGSRSRRRRAHRIARPTRGRNSRSARAARGRGRCNRVSRAERGLRRVAGVRDDRRWPRCACRAPIAPRGTRDLGPHVWRHATPAARHTRAGAASGAAARRSLRCGFAGPDFFWAAGGLISLLCASNRIGCRSR